MSDLAERINRTAVTMDHCDPADFDSQLKEVKQLEQRNAELEARLSEQHLPSYKDLESMYDAQCKCTDEWAGKCDRLQRENAELKADMDTWKRRYAEVTETALQANNKLKQQLAELERKIEVPCAQRDEYLRERNEARQQLAELEAEVNELRCWIHAAMENHADLKDSAPLICNVERFKLAMGESDE